jgi:HEAT repeat protein
LHLYYTIEATTPTALVARLSATSHEVYSPYMDIDDPDEEDLTGAKHTIDLGAVSYPRGANPAQLLPPVLLIEALDEPHTAEDRYGAYGGYRYLGQMLLPGTVCLGEPVDVCLSREALSLWLETLPRSEAHQRALANRARELAALFLIDPSDITPARESTSSEQSRLVRSASADLESPDEPTRLAALKRLSQLEAGALPIPSLLPRLADDSDEVRQLAIALLGAAKDRLKIEWLERIADQAELPARLAAVALLGRVGGEQAVALLEGACNRRRPEMRMAGLRALFEACYGSDLHPVGYLDVLTYLRSALRSDDVPAVRAVAAELVDRLGGPSALDTLIARYEQRG